LEALTWQDNEKIGGYVHIGARTEEGRKEGRNEGRKGGREEGAKRGRRKPWKDQNKNR